MFSNLFSHLKSRLSETLPGLEAQLKMAPSIRTNLMNSFDQSKLPRQSAVLILLYPFENEIYTVFMKRSNDGTVHSGQISLPGGQVEPEDNSLIETALREAEEEMGIKAKDVNVLGQISPLMIPVSNFTVQPVVCCLDYRPTFVPNPSEVQEIIELRLSHLLNPQNCATEILSRHQVQITAPYYDAHGHHIWGATAMIMSEFLEIIRELEHVHTDKRGTSRI